MMTAALSRLRAIKNLDKSVAPGIILRQARTSPEESCRREVARSLGGSYGVPLRYGTCRTKGVAMVDSTFLMFALVMLAIFVGGIIVYKKSQ